MVDDWKTLASDCLKGRLPVQDPMPSFVKDVSACRKDGGPLLSKDALASLVDPFAKKKLIERRLSISLDSN